MNVLVAYASRHGATQGIAERIAESLRGFGLNAEARPAASRLSGSNPLIEAAELLLLLLVLVSLVVLLVVRERVPLAPQI